MSFTKEQLLSGEELISLEHQHVIVLFKPILLNIVCAAVFSILSYELRNYWSTSYWLIFLCLLPLGMLGWAILVRNGREYIVTDRRVVRTEGVFSSSSFDAPLDKINNVFHEQSIMGRLFKYGRVGLETASEQGTTGRVHSAPTRLERATRFERAPVTWKDTVLPLTLSPRFPVLHCCRMHGTAFVAATTIESAIVPCPCSMRDIEMRQSCPGLFRLGWWRVRESNPSRLWERPGYSR